MTDFTARCQKSSPAWGHIGRTEIRAVAMIASGRILTYGAWMAVEDPRLN